MTHSTTITQLLDIQYPIIQGGMIWASGWELASAVSNAGGLGVIGAGSMQADTLRRHIQRAQQATKNPLAVNVPLLYSHVESIMDVLLQEKIKIVFTSAGNPKQWTARLQAQGIKVVHVVSNLTFALKAQAAGVDAIVGEGFEAGGHNGREELTTLCLIPLLKKHTQIPIIAAGGIGSGQAWFAAEALGADAVQIGTRFLLSYEASCHPHFKDLIVQATENSTMLTLKELTPVRLLKNDFYNRIEEAYRTGAKVEDLLQLKSFGRPKKGMFEGDLVNGMLEAGQVCVQFDKIRSVREIFDELIDDYCQTRTLLTT